MDVDGAGCVCRRGVVDFVATVTRNISIITLAAEAEACTAVPVCVDVLLAGRDGWDEETVALLMEIVRPGMVLEAEGLLEDIKADHHSSNTGSGTAVLQPIAAGSTPATAAEQQRPSPAHFCLHPHSISLLDATGEVVVRAGPSVSAAAKAATAKVRKTGAGRKNGSKSHKFAKFLVDTFGREALKGGTGVVDVAGGNGDLAHCLSSLYRIPCTVIDTDLRPRSKQAEWAYKLREGWVKTLQQCRNPTPLVKQMLSTWQVAKPNHIPGLFLGVEDAAFCTLRSHHD
eukprot:gene28162-24166_t